MIYILRDKKKSQILFQFTSKEIFITFILPSIINFEIKKKTQI